MERGLERKKKIQGLVISGRPREDCFKERAVMLGAADDKCWLLLRRQVKKGGPRIGH